MTKVVNALVHEPMAKSVPGVTGEPFSRSRLLAETAGVDRLAVLDDRDRQAGDLEVGDGLVDDRVETLHRPLHRGARIGRAGQRALHRPPRLRQGSLDGGAVGRERPLEGRVAGQALDPECDRVPRERDALQRTILDALGGDGDIARPAGALGREVDVELEGRGPQVQDALPVPGERVGIALGGPGRRRGRGQQDEQGRRCGEASHAGRLRHEIMPRPSFRKARSSSG